jgi:hypothetical protein
VFLPVLFGPVRGIRTMPDPLQEAGRDHPDAVIEPKP